MTQFSSILACGGRTGRPGIGSSLLVDTSTVARFRCGRESAPTRANVPRGFDPPESIAPSTSRCITPTPPSRWHAHALRASWQSAHPTGPLPSPRAALSPQVLQVPCSQAITHPRSGTRLAPRPRADRDPVGDQRCRFARFLQARKDALRFHPEDKFGDSPYRPKCTRVASLLHACHMAACSGRSTAK